MSAALLLLATLSVAEKSPLLGLTREQLLDREGEPKSQIVAGGREVIFLRASAWCGVVVEVDLLPADPAGAPPGGPDARGRTRFAFVGRTVGASSVPADTGTSGQQFP